jgi:hypothetical protein
VDVLCFVNLFVIIRQRVSIVGLENQIDQSEETTRENKRLQGLFGSLMQQGISISSRLANCQAKPQFDFWDGEFDLWLDTVRKFISQDLGYATDSVEFIRAGENAEPIIGILDFRKKQEERYRVLEQHQQKLEEIVHRRLP